MKKFIPLLFSSICLASSCSCFGNDGKIKIAKNLDVVLFDKENDYLDADYSEISANLDVNANFALYFSEDGCSSCEEFSPIIDSYLKESNMMVYKIDVNEDKEVFNKLQKEYSTKLFNNEETLSLPALCVYANNEANYVDYSSHMKTEMAFKNYMNQKYRVVDLCFTSGDIYSLDFVDRKFAYINFDFENDRHVNLFKTKLEKIAYSSNRTVIISNYNEDDIVHIRYTGKNAKGERFSIKEFGVNEDTNENVVREVL